MALATGERWLRALMGETEGKWAVAHDERNGGVGRSGKYEIDDERQGPKLGKEEDGDDFGANPTDFLHGGVELGAKKHLNAVVRRGEDVRRFHEGWQW